MKALSIKQPWAWLIVKGWKTIENRTWSASGHYDEEILLHAGLKFDASALDWLCIKEKDEILNSVNEHFEVDYNIDANTGRAKFLRCNAGEFGGIIGSFTIGEDMECCDNNIWAMPNNFHWQIENVKALPFERCKGQLRFFEVK